MSQLYPKDLANAGTVVLKSDSMVSVITDWTSSRPAEIKDYTVSDVDRLREYCEAKDVYFVDSPSKPLCEFDDSGEDYTHDPKWYATLRVSATTKVQALAVANEVSGILGAVEVVARGQWDLDCPSYPDLIYRFSFTLYFAHEPDWNRLPLGEFRLKE